LSQLSDRRRDVSLALKDQKSEHPFMPTVKARFLECSYEFEVIVDYTKRIGLRGANI